MKYPHVRITLKCMFAIVAVIAAYVGGLVSNRVLLRRAWEELDAAREQLTLERRERELQYIAKEFLAVTASEDVSRERLSKLVNRYNAYCRDPEAGPPPSRAEVLRHMRSLRGRKGDAPH